MVNIPKKELKTDELGFSVVQGMGYYHVENSFYLGGGSAGDDQILLTIHLEKNTAE